MAKLRPAWLRKFGQMWKILRKAPRGSRLNIVKWNALFLFNTIRGKQTVLFECQQPRDWGFLEPIFRALQKQSNVRCCILLNDRPARAGGVGLDVDTVKETLQTAAVDMSCVAQRLGNALFFADIYLTPTTYNNFLPADRTILRGALPHGLVNKLYLSTSNIRTNQHGPEMADFDVLLSTGPECTQKALPFRAHYGHTYDIWNVGYPKIDGLLNRQISPKGSAPPVSPKSIHVLFAPSWGRKTALDVYGLSPVAWALEEGHKVTIKLHPMSLSKGVDYATGGVDWKQELAKFESDPNVSIADTTVNEELMAQADLMISDVSGIAYEFLLTGKPVIFLDVPEFFAEMAADVGSACYEDLSFWGRSYGRIVSAREEMMAALDDYAQGRWTMESVDGLRERLLYNPGCAGQAAASCIIEYCKTRKSRTMLSDGSGNTITQILFVSK